MGFTRPKVGVQVVRVDRIRTSNRAKDPEVDEAITKIAEDGIPEPLPVFWSQFDWQNGFVDYKGPAATIQALRHLGHIFVEADVQVDPASGLNFDSKEYPLKVIRELR